MLALLVRGGARSITYFGTILIDDLPQVGLPEPLPQHAKPQERQGELPGQEDPPDMRRQVDEGMADAANDQVFERRRLLGEKCSLVLSGNDSVVDEPEW